MRLPITSVRNVTVAILLIGAVFILGCTSPGGNTLTGNAVALEGVRTWVSCTETDKNEQGQGNNALKAGTTAVEYRRAAAGVAEKSSFADRCSGKKVLEYYCKDKRAYWGPVNCEQFGKNYVCKNNACVKK